MSDAADVKKSSYGAADAVLKYRLKARIILDDDFEYLHYETESFCEAEVDHRSGDDE